MNVYKIAVIITLSLCFKRANAQSFLDNYNKDISFSLGTLNALGEMGTAEFGGVFYRSFGPALHANVLFAKSNKQGLSIGLDLAQFWNVSDDTITMPSIDNDFFFKAFDFNGQVQFGSINANWVRFFGQNEKCTPFIETGGEVILRRRTILRVLAISSEFAGVEELFIPVTNDFFFSGRVGFGLKHQLSKRIKIFEEVSGSYMLFTRQNGPDQKWFFSPLINDQYLLLNLSVGITFSLDQE